MQNADPGEVGVSSAYGCGTKLHRPHRMMVMAVMMDRAEHDSTVSHDIDSVNKNL
jgi:hypothetical protein